LFYASVIMSNLMLSLPLSGSGLFSNGGGPGSTGLLSTNENLLTWLGESVIPVLFQDAVCGDGKCEAPEEEKGYGRFGWFVLLPSAAVPAAPLFPASRRHERRTRAASGQQRAGCGTVAAS
jgi:hypothetical protein